MLMLPELVVIATALGLLIVDLLVDEKRRTILAPLGLLGLAAAMATLVLTPRDGSILGGQFAMDGVAWWFKVAFILAAAITIMISMDLLDGRALVRARGMGFRGEFYSTMLMTVAGMMYLISARDLVTLYVALELATIPLFALAAWQRDTARSGEAGLKYVIVGALASAFILYGLGFLYGLTGSVQLDVIGKTVAAGGQSPALWLAAALVLAGVGFKMTLVPFHMWAADVYEGAPVPVTAYLSAGSKAAGLAFAFQLFFRMLGVDPAGPAPSLLVDWSMLLAIIAAATMTLGNLVAIVQQNIKRFMAFSSISQAGYILLGFLVPTAAVKAAATVPAAASASAAAGAAGDFGGVPAMVFYMLVYIVTNLTVFACIVWYSNQTGREKIDDYRGLSRTNPMIALAMMVALFSLAGIPPLSGFVGKFFLFSIASAAGFHWLVAVAAVNSTISLYYYLRIVRQMYIEPVDAGAARLPIGRPLAVTMGVLSVGVVLLGLVPSIYQAIHNDTVGWLNSLAR